MWKGGQNLQSGWLTHLVDQHICWCGWCCLAVPFVVSVLFDDKICWYGQAFRINILCNRPILLMEQIMLLSENLRCAKVAVQLLQCSLHCAMWPVYICKGLQYILHCLFICLLLLFVCCVSYVYCVSLGEIVVSLGVLLQQHSFFSLKNLCCTSSPVQYFGNKFNCFHLWLRSPPSWPRESPSSWIKSSNCSRK